MTRDGGRRRHPPHRRHAHGRRGARVRGAARRRSQRIRAAAVRRRRRRACGGGRRGTRHAPHHRAGAARRVFGARPALHRRAARLHPLRTVSARPARSRRMPRASFASWRRRRRANLPKRGSTRSAAAFERELDMRYAGQGYELRVSLDGLVARARSMPRRSKRRGRGSTICTRASTAMPPRRRASKW